MRLNLDPTLFDEQQLLFVRELAHAIRVKLHEAGLTGDPLDEATAAVVFSVASAIDDTAAIERDGTEVHPYLTFRTADGELTHCGENSYTHEFVYEALQGLQEQRAR